MPLLLRKIEANILDNFTTDINILTISGTFGSEDYININGFEAFLQNFTKISETEYFNQPKSFGLVRNNKEEFIEIEISY